MPAIALVCGRGVREDCAKEVRFQQSVQGQYSGRAQLPAPAPRMIISTDLGQPCHASDASHGGCYTCTSSVQAHGLATAAQGGRLAGA
jgi:hypothetical protein